jgi:hypothetical protein
LYPISANPDRVMARMNLTPAWLGAYLKLTGKEIEMTEEQRTAVDAIIESVPPHRRNELLDR